MKILDNFIFFFINSTDAKRRINISEKIVFFYLKNKFTLHKTSLSKYNLIDTKKWELIKMKLFYVSCNKGIIP